MAKCSRRSSKSSKASKASNTTKVTNTPKAIDATNAIDEAIDTTKAVDATKATKTVEMKPVNASATATAQTMQPVQADTEVVTAKMLPESATFPRLEMLKKKSSKSGVIVGGASKGMRSKLAKGQKAKTSEDRVPILRKDHNSSDNPARDAWERKIMAIKPVKRDKQSKISEGGNDCHHSTSPHPPDSPTLSSTSSNDSSSSRYSMAGSESINIHFHPTAVVDDYYTQQAALQSTTTHSDNLLDHLPLITPSGDEEEGDAADPPAIVETVDDADIEMADPPAPVEVSNDHDVGTSAIVDVTEDLDARTTPTEVIDDGDIDVDMPVIHAAVLGVNHDSDIGEPTTPAVGELIDDVEVADKIDDAPGTPLTIEETIDDHKSEPAPVDVDTPITPTVVEVTENTNELPASEEPEAVTADVSLLMLSEEDVLTTSDSESQLSDATTQSDIAWPCVSDTAYELYHTNLGTVSLAEFISTTSFNENGFASRQNIAQTFIGFSRREKEFLGMRVNSATDTKATWASPATQATTRVGSMSLIRFLKLLSFDVHGNATILGVGDAFKKAAAMEVEMLAKLKMLL